MTHLNPRVAIVAEHHPDQQACAQLAQKWHLPLLPWDHIESCREEFDLILMNCDGQLGLALPSDLTHPLMTAFFSRSLKFRIDRANAKNELLLRALGSRRGESLYIVDATAGLGRDAFLLVSSGHHVTMCERSPILAAMLHSALRALQTESHETASHLSLYEGNAVGYLRHLQTVEPRPQIVYLDPMFPQRTKTALVKKDMQVLQKLLGVEEDDTDADVLLAAARACALRRIIVKRPILAPCFANQPASFAYFGKQIRFDVYLPVSSTMQDEVI